MVRRRETARRLAGYLALLADVASGEAPPRAVGPGASEGVRPVRLALSLTVRKRYTALRGRGTPRPVVLEALTREFDLSARTIACLCLGAEPPRPALVVTPTYVVRSHGRAA